MRQVDVAHQAEHQRKPARHEEIEPGQRHAVEQRVDQHLLGAEHGDEPGGPKGEEQPQHQGSEDRRGDDGGGVLHGVSGGMVRSILSQRTLLPRAGEGARQGG